MAAFQPSVQQCSFLDYGSARVAQSPSAALLPTASLPQRNVDVRGLAGDLPGLAMPWLLFTVSLLSCFFPEDNLLGYVAIVGTLSLSAGFIFFSKSKPWLILAVICLVSSLLGFGLGALDGCKCWTRYLIYSHSVTYQRVAPREHPDAYRDAGLIAFSGDTFIDRIRSVGYHDRGIRWCVAPVVNNSLQLDVGFWVVGINCCEARGDFYCGSDTTGGYGVVVQDGSSLDVQEQVYYRIAAEVASAQYGVHLPAAPIFVKWGMHLEDELSALYSTAVSFAFMADAFFLLATVGAVLVLLLLGLSLQLQPPSPSWHRDQEDIFVFGFSLRVRDFPNSVGLDLLSRRAHWTGEVVLDYAFHIANTSAFVSPFLCHPANPYGKLERFAALLIVGPLCVFLPALVTMVSESSVARLLLVLMLTMLTRSLMRANVLNLGKKEDILNNEQVDTADAFRWVAIFLASCSILTLIACILSVKYISLHSDDTSEILLGSLNGLSYAFVAELLLDCFMPFSVHRANQWIWGVGFFGRWMIERDQQEAHHCDTGYKDDRGEAMMLEAGRGQPLKGHKSRRPRNKHGHISGGACGMLMATPKRKELKEPG